MMREQSMTNQGKSPHSVAGHLGIESVSDPAVRAIAGLKSETDRCSGPLAEDRCRVLAFYLPQYHAIRENDTWWGPGFTEWTNVARARPNFEQHHQPNIPRDLGFYDLTNLQVMRSQAELARLYGISGFCFYHYWFSGRRVLEYPVNSFLKSDIDLSFCLCWANENWTRTWDGDDKHILLEQCYAPGDDERFFGSIKEALHDPRYVRIDGLPLLIVYRAKQIPSPQKTFATWRRLAKSSGLPGLHIAAVDFYDISHPDEVGADSLVEFPPHKFNGPLNRPERMPQLINPTFRGHLVDYRKVILQSLDKAPPRFTYFRGIIPDWDNTPRRQDTPTTMLHASPKLFGEWLSYLRAYTRQYAARSDEAIIFINAWNEWGEGAYLEPDVRYGLQRLEKVLSSRYYEMGLSLEEQVTTLKNALKDDASSSVNGRAPVISEAPPQRRKNLRGRIGREIIRFGKRIAGRDGF